MRGPRSPYVQFPPELIVKLGPTTQKIAIGRDSFVDSLAILMRGVRIGPQEIDAMRDDPQLLVDFSICLVLPVVQLQPTIDED